MNSSDSHFEKGELVVINPFFTCNSCSACFKDQSNNCQHRTTIGLKGPSGFSEYILVPETSVYKVRQDMDPYRLCLAEPLANVIYGIDKLRLAHDQKIRINGAGAIGLMFLQLLGGMMPSLITVCDMNESRLERARAMGADRLVNPRRDVDEELYDVIIDCTGNVNSIQSSFERMDFGCQFLSFGVCSSADIVKLSPFEIYRKDASFMGSFALNKSSMEKAVRLLESNRFDSSGYIDSIRPVEELEDAIKAMASGRTSGKIVIKTN